LKKLCFGTLLLALTIAVPIPTKAGVEVSVNIGLPPPIVFAAPPEMIVLPETYVYVVPDIDVDIFFYNGWWWRPWEGHWYRSRYYNRSWVHYGSVPRFYTEVPSAWRNDYRDHRWGGHQWNYQRIPQQKVQQNWKGWEKNRYWEKQQTWGVQGLQPRTQSSQPARTVQSQQPVAQARPVQPQHREAAPQPREAQPERATQQHREAGPQSPEVVQPQQPVAQQRAAQTQHSPQQHGEVQPQHSQEQHREGGPQSQKGKPEQSQGHRGGSERGNAEKQDKK
jgi:hypothetical protein